MEVQKMVTQQRKRLHRCTSQIKWKSGGRGPAAADDARRSTPAASSSDVSSPSFVSSLKLIRLPSVTYLCAWHEA